MSDRLVAHRKRDLPKGALKQIESLAASGAREEEIARALNVSPPTWRAIKARDPKALAAFEAGRGALYQRLLGMLLDPSLPEKGSVSERIAVLRARHMGAMAALNSLFGWRQDQAPPAAKLQVEIRLPGPMSPDEYRRVIDGSAKHVDDDA